MSNVQQVAQAILDTRRVVRPGESMLVAISGIDGCGKGFLTGQLAGELCNHGINAVSINADGWLNLPSKRFNKDQPAEHFYRHAFRFDELFGQLVLPLKQARSIRVETDFTEETAQEYRRHTYEFENVDVILLEGIYLLQAALRHHYDWKVWVDCSFETALERALQRGQEGLPADETIKAYHTIYFPAQELHFHLDNPKAAADSILLNDPRLMQPKP